MLIVVLLRFVLWLCLLLSFVAQSLCVCVMCSFPANGGYCLGWRYHVDCGRLDCCVAFPKVVKPLGTACTVGATGCRVVVAVVGYVS